MAGPIGDKTCMRSIILCLCNTLAAALFAVALFFGVAGPAFSAPQPLPGPGVQGEEGYRLGSGDKLRVTVFGEAELGGEYYVDGNGKVDV